MGSCNLPNLNKPDWICLNLTGSDHIIPNQTNWSYSQNIIHDADKWWICRLFAVCQFVHFLWVPCILLLDSWMSMISLFCNLCMSFFMSMSIDLSVSASYCTPLCPKGTVVNKLSILCQTESNYDTMHIDIHTIVMKPSDQSIQWTMKQSTPGNTMKNICISMLHRASKPKITVTE